jgi:hypothetical protein
LEEDPTLAVKREMLNRDVTLLKEAKKIVEEAEIADKL